MKISTVFLTALLLNIQVRAQTAAEIIDKNIQAVGGKEVIQSIRSEVIQSDMSTMGSNLSGETTILAGKGFRNEAIFNGQSIIQVVTPAGAWTINPLRGTSTPQTMPEDQAKGARAAYEIGGELFDYAAKGSTAELLGKENVEGIAAYKIKLTDKDGIIYFFYIDPSTYYIIKRETKINIGGKDMILTATFSNYKKTDIGYVIPYTTINNQGFEVTINVTKAEFNKEIDPKIFDMPK